ncbi:hypothetical protein Ancab_012538 [Ancistrocladus abbreviatus]
MADPSASNRSEIHDEKNVKVPNLIERAKEEIDAGIHRRSPKHHKETHGASDDIDENTPIDEVKGPNVFERMKEEFEAIAEAIHQKKHTDERTREETEAADTDSKKSLHHHKETHGTSDDIDATTPVNEVKGPNVFERMKEEVEAVVEALHQKKDSSNHK